MLKILFIARRFPPSVGGMERFAFDLAGSLEKEIDLIRITWGGSNKWLPVILPLFFFRAFWILSRDRKITVIHMQDAVQAPLGWLLSKIFNRPFIVVAHGLDITYNSLFYQSVVIPFVKKADRVICISSATRDACISKGVDSNILEVITLGVHDDYNGTPKSNRSLLQEKIELSLKDKKILITTGRLVKRKGVEWFIRNVLPGLIKNDKGIIYLVAGDGEERGNIEAAIKDEKISKNVKLLGRVDDDTKSLLYQSADIFIMPNIVVNSDMEGFGIVAHEAATASTTVVASGIEGILDAVSDGKNGFLLKSKDASSFIKKIDEMLNDSIYNKSFGKKARDFTLSNYSWDKIANYYIKVYKKITN